MGWDYALIHLQFTIPPALVLTFVLAPLLIRVDVYKVGFLITVAVIWTIPWDSYLVHHSIWTYPPDSILGPTLFQIPAEELFFFVIQTYITSLLYILLNKPSLFPIYLAQDQRSPQDGDLLAFDRAFGQIFISGTMLASFMVSHQGNTYMNLIVLWAGPVLLLLWSLSYRMLMYLPSSKVILPIAIPTIYLWTVDTLALRKGTWAISSGTKWDFQPWPGMEIEEAVFFLLTNTLVVFGLVAFDNANAIIDVFPSQFPNVSAVPSPREMVLALLLPSSMYDSLRLQGLRDSLTVLQKKSRSFYLASSVFRGRLRIDLILLYAYCRVADDLIDNSGSVGQAAEWIKKLSTFLSLKFDQEPMTKTSAQRLANAIDSFPRESQRILLQLPSSHIPSQPLYDLLDGFRTDLGFPTQGSSKIPIRTMLDLSMYSHRVASTVAILCLNLVYFHHPQPETPAFTAKKQKCMSSAINMGKALQYINIVRDVVVDAQNGRCYLPTELLEANGITSAGLIRLCGQTPAVAKVRRQILEEAMKLYERNVDSIEDLPLEARGGIRVAVEAYIEIGRAMMQTGFDAVDANGGAGRKATVPKWRRLMLAWIGMAGFGRGRNSRSY